MGVANLHIFQCNRNRGYQLLILLVLLFSKEYALADLPRMECSWTKVSVACEASKPQVEAALKKWELDVRRQMEEKRISLKAISKEGCLHQGVDDEFNGVPEKFEPLSRTFNTIHSESLSITIGDRGLPSNIVINNKNLLSSSIDLYSNNRNFLNNTGSLIEEWTSYSGLFEKHSQFKTNSIKYTSKTTVGYDRLIHIKLTIEPLQNVALNNIGISIPLNAEYVDYIASSNEGTLLQTQNNTFERKTYEHRILQKKDISINHTMDIGFSNIVRLVGKEVGLYLTFESDKYWIERDAQTFTLRREGKSIILDMPFIRNMAFELNQEIELEFALGVLPVRKPDTWENISFFNTAQFKDAKSSFNRKLFDKGSFERSLAYKKGFKVTESQSAIDEAVESGLKTIILHQQWTDLQGYPGVKQKELLEYVKKFVKYAHDRELKVVIYLGLELSEAAPEWPNSAVRMASYPLVKGRTRDRVISIRPNVGSPCFQNYLLSNLKALVQETDIDGVFLDLIPDAERDANYFNGSGYIDADGRLRTEKQILSTRNLLKKIYEMFHGGLKQDGIVIGHVTNMFEPAHAFVDYLLVGEKHIKYSRSNPEVKVNELISPDQIKALYLPKLNGIPLFWLSKENRGGPSVEEARPHLLPYGLLQRTQWPHFIFNNSWQTMLNPTKAMVDEWRIWRAISALGQREGEKKDDEKVEFVPYWQNDQHYSNNGLGKAQVSLWFAKNNKALLVLANTSEESIQGQLLLNFNKLGISQQDIQFIDLLNAKTIIANDNSGLDIVLERGQLLVVITNHGKL